MVISSLDYKTCHYFTGSGSGQLQAVVTCTIQYITKHLNVLVQDVVTCTMQKVTKHFQQVVVQAVLTCSSVTYNATDYKALYNLLHTH